MTNKIFCPKCKSENVIVSKVKQSDESIGPCVITGDIPAFNFETKETSRSKLRYDPYFCSDCSTLFGVVELGKPTGYVTK